MATNMNSPYMGKFKVSQQFKGAAHDGLDLVGIDSKEIHATFTGTVKYAGWENPADHKQGFGQYVCIEFFYAPMSKKLYAYYGHLSEIKVKVGQEVKVTDIVGIEGHTGYTIPDDESGSHCHYCIRPAFASGCFVDVCEISGIPNVKDGIYDDGYRPAASVAKATKTINAIIEIEGHKYSGLLSEI